MKREEEPGVRGGRSRESEISRSKKFVRSGEEPSERIERETGEKSRREQNWLQTPEVVSVKPMSRCVW